MKYFYEPHNFIRVFGRTYVQNDSVYRAATLFFMKGKGLCVIQMRYDPETKSFYWDEIDPGLANDIFLNPGFGEYFDKHATVNDQNGFFTVNVRSIMWSLRMKPLRKEWWETYI